MHATLNGVVPTCWHLVAGFKEPHDAMAVDAVRRDRFAVVGLHHAGRAVYALATGQKPICAVAPSHFTLSRVASYVA